MRTYADIMKEIRKDYFDLPLIRANTQAELERKLTERCVPLEDMGEQVYRFEEYDNIYFLKKDLPLIFKFELKAKKLGKKIRGFMNNKKFAVNAFLEEMRFSKYLYSDALFHDYADNEKFARLCGRCSEYVIGIVYELYETFALIRHFNFGDVELKFQTRKTYQEYFLEAGYNDKVINYFEEALKIYGGL